jgi:hypothetical protein
VINFVIDVMERLRFGAGSDEPGNRLSRRRATRR